MKRLPSLRCMLGIHRWSYVTFKFGSWMSCDRCHGKRYQ